MARLTAPVEPYRLCRRTITTNATLPAHLPPLLRRLYAARGVTNGADLEYRMAYLLHYNQLNGLENAVTLLQQNIEKNQMILIVGDFDVDGATSTALTLLALRSMGAQKVDYLVPSRFTEGYGLTPAVVEKAQTRGAQLIVTVDTGITSYAGIQLAQTMGMQVLVTDHHLPGETLPPAEAIVNPNVPGCPFPSKALAGVGVSFYLMLALRAHLRQSGWFNRWGYPEPNLAQWLDLVALGTVADIVPFDVNNRILIYQGLNRIRAGCCRPGIKALLMVAKHDPNHLSASDLGFILGPRLNAAGRLEEMSLGVELLLCDDFNSAYAIACQLEQLNQKRQTIEKEMESDALIHCQKLFAQQLPVGLALYHPSWHQGITGVVAARLKTRFYRPVIVFALTHGTCLKGSGRSIPGCHLRELIAQLNHSYPDLLNSFGGHAMAVGLTMEQRHLTTFQQAFTTLVAAQLTPSHLQAIVWSDGPLTTEELTLETALQLRAAGPWGTDFPEPLFDGTFHLLQQQLVANKHLKMVIAPLGSKCVLHAIAFHIDREQWPNPNVKKVALAYHLHINTFGLQLTLQLIVKYLWPGQ